MCECLAFMVTTSEDEKIRPKRGCRVNRTHTHLVPGINDSCVSLCSVLWSFRRTLIASTLKGKSRPKSFSPPVLVSCLSCVSVYCLRAVWCSSVAAAAAICLLLSLCLSCVESFDRRTFHPPLMSSCLLRECLLLLFLQSLLDSALMACTLDSGSYIISLSLFPSLL